MPQDETVALEIDGQQLVDPRGPKVQESISSGMAMKEAQRCLRCDYREEEVQE
jgi:hypothetical protein